MKSFVATIKRIKESDSFIGEYLRYCDAQETAIEYDFFCACWLLTNAVGRRVKVDRPRAPVWLNWYIVLVAESGVTRKSSAVRTATDLLRGLKENASARADFEMITTKCTPESLCDALKSSSISRDDSHVAISVSEMVTFFGRSTYLMAMPSLLTDLYDCPSFIESSGTITRGDFAARNVFLTLLTASTPSWLIRSINPNIIEGGFTSRTLFIHAESPKRRIAWPESEQDSRDKLRKSVADKLQHAYERSRLAIDVSISDAALKRFRDWYATRKLSFEPFRSSFESREDAHILRMAATLAISDGNWRIEIGHIRDAISIIAHVKETSAAFFVSGEKATQFAVAFDKVRDCLIREGLDGCTTSQLIRATQHIAKADVIHAMLSVMHELELVQRFDGIKVQRGRPITLFRATNRLLRKGVADQVFESMMPRS